MPELENCVPDADISEDQKDIHSIIFHFYIRQELPAEIWTKNSAEWVVKISVSVHYPDGEKMDTVRYKDSNSSKSATKVMVSLDASSSSEREAIKNGKTQPYLMRGKKLRWVSEEEHKSAVENFKYSEVEDVKDRLIAKIVSYKNLHEGISQEVEKRVEKLYGERHQQLELSRSKFGEEEQALERSRMSIEKRKDDCDKATETLEKDKKAFEELDGPRLVEMFKPRWAEQDKDKRDSIKSDERPEGVTPASLKGELEKNNYKVEKELLMQFFLSICVAASTGQFIVLSGPPGSGKTSLVKKMATLLGAGYGVVPVRPAWIDPTDLLGFYNPSPGVERYQPTPFMDALLVAKTYSELNRLYFLTLDEMNLGRVENYAADFMAQMEKARESDAKSKEACLQLYSEDIFKRMEKEKDLAMHLDNYPARMPIPPGLVLFGTVNLDESTHKLSPKFLDRAMVIQVPSQLPALRVSGTEPMKEFPLAHQVAMAITHEASQLEDWNKIWEDVKNWQENYLRHLGVHLSHRFAQTFLAYMNAAASFDLTATNDAKHEVASTFFLAKILPLISFRSGEKTDEATERNKIDVLKEWGKGLKAYPVLEKAIQKLAAKTSFIISFLE